MQPNDEQIPAAIPNSPPQPEPQFVIQALQDEITHANQNRLYLIACLNQLQAEFRDAQAMWALERESILAARSESGD